MKKAVGNDIKLKKIDKKDEKTDEETNELIKSLKNDENLKENTDLRLKMIAMATMFLQNFSKNMYKTSIEMNEIMPYHTIDEWKSFLNYPVVRKYIKSFRDEKIGIIAEQGLADGNKDAINIKKSILENGPTINNSNLILIRLPEKQDFD